MKEWKRDDKGMTRRARRKQSERERRGMTRSRGWGRPLYICRRVLAWEINHKRTLKNSWPITFCHKPGRNRFSTWGSESQRCGEIWSIWRYIERKPASWHPMHVVWYLAQRMALYRRTNAWLCSDLGSGCIIAVAWETYVTGPRNGVRRAPISYVCPGFNLRTV